VDIFLLASAFLAGSGRVGAARDALAAVEAAAEDALGHAAPAGAPAPSPLLAMLAANTLLRTGEFRAAAGVHEGLLLRAQAGGGGAKKLLPLPRDGGAAAHAPTATITATAAAAPGAEARADRLSRALTQPWPPHADSGGGGAAAAAMPAVGRGACAAALGMAGPAVPSHMTLLLSTAAIDCQVGRFDSAASKLGDAASLLSGVLGAGAGGRNASAMLPTPVRSPSGGGGGGSSVDAPAPPPAPCALPVLLLQQRLLQGTRRSALSLEAALSDWRWMWASGALSAAVADGGNNPSDDGITNTTNNNNDDTNHNNNNEGAFPAVDEDIAAFPLLSCGPFSDAGTGGWGDVARVAMASGSGASGSALALWAPVLARTLRVLGPAHPDTAAALHIQGVLLREAGDFIGALVAQRGARSALLQSGSARSGEVFRDGAGGSEGAARNPAANRSIVYLRSLMHSAELLFAAGDSARGLKYLNTSTTLANALGAHPLAATVLGLRALLSDDAAAQQLFVACSNASAAEKGGAPLAAAAPPAPPLVCRERAAIRAAGAHKPLYAAGAAAWAALPPSSRVGNADFVAFAAHHELARARTASSNATVLEAAVRQLLLGEFNAYEHLGLGAPLAPARAPVWVAPPLPPPGGAETGASYSTAPAPPRGGGGSPRPAGVAAVPAMGAAAASAAAAARPSFAEGSLFLSSVALTARALSAEGDHASAHAYLAEVEAVLAAEAARGGAAPGSASGRRTALARAATSFSRAAVHAQWHAQLTAGKGDALAAAKASTVTAAAAATRARSRRERTRLLAAVSAATDHYTELGVEQAAAAGFAYHGSAGAALPWGASAPAATFSALTPAAETVIDHATTPAGLGSGAVSSAPADAADDALASFVSRAAEGKEGRAGANAGAGGGAPTPAPGGAAGARHNSFAVDPYSFDTFLGDGRGYFALQSSVSLASSQADGSGGGGGGASAAEDAPATVAASSFSAFALKNLRQVRLHMDALAQGLDLRSMELQLAPVRRVALGLLRYALLAFSCSMGSGDDATLSCAPLPRSAVPPAFLELFNARALPHMDKHELLTPRGAEYLEALTEEALGAKRTWSLALADNGHLARVRSPRLARLAAVGLPVVVEDE
jgi:hypothetical protein